MGEAAATITPHEKQRTAALKKANRIRMATATVKADIKARTLTFADALEDPRASGARVYTLLLAQPRWGRGAVVKVLRIAGVSEMRTVRQLTERQHAALVQAVAPRPVYQPVAPLYPKLADAEWLRARYEDDGMSTYAIAAEVGSPSNTTVLGWMRKHKIPRRQAVGGTARRTL